MLFRSIYAARERSEFAFLKELRVLAGDELTLHCDQEAGGVLDVGQCFGALDGEARVYACGPRPMLKACMATARSLGWPRDRLAFELFYSVAP